MKEMGRRKKKETKKKEEEEEKKKKNERRKEGGNQNARSRSLLPKWRSSADQEQRNWPDKSGLEYSLCKLSDVLRISEFRCVLKEIP
jgi:hypothetical protein